MDYLILGLPLSRWLVLAFGVAIIIVILRQLPSQFTEKHIKIFLLAPTVVWIVGMVIFPLLYALYISFLNKGAGITTSFAGLSNYTRLFKDYKFWASVRFTALFVAIAVTVELGLGFLLALLVNEEIRGKKLFRLMFLLPLFTPPVALGFLAFTMVYESGPLNALLSLFGVGPLAWTADPAVAPFTIILLDIWEWTPFCFLVILAGLQLVPEDLIEAAYMDTKSSFQVFRHVTFPFVRPAFLTAMMLRLIEALKLFDVPYALTYGGPGLATESYSILTYKTALKHFTLGRGAALAFLFLIAILILFSVLFRISRFSQVYE
ncbi:ABC transporter permease subunit [candidate division KSB3 bacterium]|uniref:ABC transporter permease subunit n=1 Tax=candidate division KSB3 bacterium TaxID=2044937 RepID=A0A9D5Q6Q5_9BACT|nr:ABC transporter permease subunit [candidate division KSB3 bacterium]MBD3325156.1 ABC transporter permease subunit [candidate division KSB3 bacterium]